MPLYIAYFALLAVAFFFLIVRPQRRQLAARRQLIAAVEVDDEIITAGGIYGTVRAIDEDVLSVEVADGVVLTLAREAVARRRVLDTEAPDSAETGEPRPDNSADDDSDSENDNGVTGVGR